MRRIGWFGKGIGKGSSQVRGSITLLEEDCDNHFPSKVIWNSWVPSTVVSSHGWLVGARRWLRINSRGGDGRWSIGVLCVKREAETIDHIFFHCDKGRVIWELIFSLFGAYWVIARTVRDTLLG